MPPLTSLNNKTASAVVSPLDLQSEDAPLRTPAACRPTATLRRPDVSALLWPPRPPRRLAAQLWAPRYLRLAPVLPPFSPPHPPLWLVFRHHAQHPAHHRPMHLALVSPPVYLVVWRRPHPQVAPVYPPTSPAALHPLPLHLAFEFTSTSQAGLDLLLLLRTPASTLLGSHRPRPRPAPASTPPPPRTRPRPAPTSPPASQQHRPRPRLAHTPLCPSTAEAAGSSRAPMRRPTPGSSC
ncbi:hypothetical protein BDZ90DRAFT_41136 [Jaminaea rosea]|uniref:Uncharacterized protein n=1 Tax=Jaminaea rosea TaxID=1569628 RepID=A0A316UMT8_9BASI|nr:hypothetical protein BDZ90DRAFT_41136 [Jaminaea rosea]PWN26550.1 hypothetical protein BDZ90DRAFT_41136 [Jaminaea rosea]